MDTPTGGGTRCWSQQMIDEISDSRAVVTHMSIAALNCNWKSMA